MNAAESVPQGNGVKKREELLGLLGENSVLIRVRKATKKPIDLNWPKFTLEESRASEYVRALDRHIHLGGSIGVALGKASENLCAIDIDIDEEIEPFLALNPALAKTLRSRGQHGCQFWLRILGEYPPLKALKYFANGEKFGEWRADGGQSVIYGTHEKTKKPYQILVRAKPIEIHFEEINWPKDKIKLPWEEPAKPKPKAKKQHEPKANPFAQGGTLGDSIKRHIRELCVHFYPNGDEEGEEWRLGSAKGEEGTSFCIHLEGDKAGLCYEHNGGYGGTFAAALAIKLNVSVEEAEKRIKRFLTRVSLKVPPTLSPKALYGIAGRIASKMAEKSEADAAGVLVQLLVAFGNMVGRRPSFRVSGSRHYCNLNTSVVGQSAKSRKGLGLDCALLFISWLDDAYIKNNVKQGLSSGEGLIAHVGDEEKRFRQPSPTEKRAGITEPIEYVAIPGVADKRLLVCESEMAGLIIAMGREGNTLSAVVREFWDGAERVGTLTKNSPMTATSAHVSLCCHITRHELEVKLPAVESFNGFANRFLWIYAKRDRYLSSPPDLSPALFREELEAFTKPNADGQTLLQRINSVWHMERDEEARIYWDEIYLKMEKNQEVNPEVDSVTARGSAQTLRLSMLFALLDGSSVIHKSHIEAAYALWRYSRDTSRYLFAEKLSTPHAERIYAALKSCSPKGMTRTEISDLFGRNLPPSALDAAIQELEDLGFVERQKDKGKGRPLTTYFFKQKKA